MSTKDQPLAHPGREKQAKELFPVAEMSPEEYAARNGVDWAAFSFDHFAYRDSALDEWVQELGRIFSTPGRLAEVQERFLTPEELQRVRKRADEPF